ncbi:MAG: molecular chaperone HtpG [Lachnospiraceae bacterium]|nr:molecular chaperone HtpG [Lachnospiraceae bacterium]
MEKQGSLSINSENIFPIIKKWLYSDHDIFIRELISNGCDAITKLKKLAMMGEFEEVEGEEYRIDVYASPKDKTITFVDNGLGMTAEEVEQYINQIAFSGATDFINKYKDKSNDDQIIGHFGLGFYSAFMVADKVTIETCSYKKDAVPVFWECDGGTEFSMTESDDDTRGTAITLYLNEDSYEFANEYRVREVIQKYCAFMPYNIYFTDEDKAEEEAKKKAEEDKKKDKVIEVDTTEEDDLVGDTADKKDAEDKADTDAESSEVSSDEENEKKETPLNNTNPLWLKNPKDCTDEEYVDFYQHVFLDFKKPLFWIHLNMDYPFNLKGILYFPKINPQYDQLEGTIKLYNNQVFVADNIKEVIPEFLMLLKGVIDCPDIPLNVSRSALQNDGSVKKISDYITKKVADKLSGMCKTDREEYEKYWDDISPFIKFGCLRDDKFCEKMTDYMLFKNLEGKYITLPDYLEAGKEKYENKVFYVSDEIAQSQYINMFKEEGIDAVYLTHNIDNPYITHLESKNENVKFLRIDADLADNFVGEALTEEQTKEYTDKLTETFKKATGKDKLTVKVESLKNENVSSMITLSEESRRMAEMMKAYSMPGMDPNMFGDEGETLVLNANNKLVKYVLDNPEGEHTNTVCCQLYDLAVLANKPLAPEAMTAFVARSNEVLNILIGE